MAYKFYGWECATVPAINKIYPGIETPLDLYDALSNVWSVESCAPNLRGEWAENNKTCGQCSITSFIVQDIFGGEVYGIPLETGDIHCFNVVGDSKFDLTSEQFGGKILDYNSNLLQTREEHFKKNPGKEDRYNLLREGLKKLTK